jgi:hypothetical protein
MLGLDLLRHARCEDLAFGEKTLSRVILRPDYENIRSTLVKSGDIRSYARFVNAVLDGLFDDANIIIIKFPLGPILEFASAPLVIQGINFRIPHFVPF